MAYGALDLGLQRTGAAEAALLDGLQSCMVLILGTIFIGEAIRRRSVAGVLIATIGGALLTGAHFTPKAGLGDALVLIGSLGASASVIVVHRLAPQTSILELTAYQFGLGFLFCLPLALIQWTRGSELVPTLSDMRYIAVAAAIGLFSFALGYFLYNYAVGEVPVGVAGIALNLIPLFGVVAAIVLLGERLTSWEVFGGLLILLGVALFPLETN